MNRVLKNMFIVLMHGQHSRYPERLSATRGRSSKRGQKTYGDRNGKRETRTSLIAGKRGHELLAPVLFKGSTNALWFNQWLEEHLMSELKPNSTLILDNAPFHRKDDVFRIAEQAGHKVLFLPPYSPDFNRVVTFTAMWMLKERIRKKIP